MSACEKCQAQLKSGQLGLEPISNGLCDECANTLLEEVRELHPEVPDLLLEEIEETHRLERGFNRPPKKEG